MVSSESLLQSSPYLASSSGTLFSSRSTAPRLICRHPLSSSWNTTLPRCGTSSSLDSAASTSMSSSSWSLVANYESLTRRLHHLDSVPRVLQELRSAFFRNERALLDEEFVCSAPMIMDLIDIAKRTLEHAGLELWPHSLCVVGLRSHKSAYFTLLKLLKSREDCLTSQLRSRSLRLTCRLSTNFSIRTNIAYDFYLDIIPRDSKRVQRVDTPYHQKLFRSMPPPDAFPPSDFIPISSLSLLNRPLLRQMRLELQASPYTPYSRSSGKTPHPRHPTSSRLHAGALGSRRPGSSGIRKRSTFYSRLNQNVRL